MDDRAGVACCSSRRSSVAAAGCYPDGSRPWATVVAVVDKKALAPAGQSNARATWAEDAECWVHAFPFARARQRDEDSHWSGSVAMAPMAKAVGT